MRRCDLCLSGPLDRYCHNYHPIIRHCQAPKNTRTSPVSRCGLLRHCRFLTPFFGCLICISTLNQIGQTPFPLVVSISPSLFFLTHSLPLLVFVASCILPPFVPSSLRFISSTFFLFIPFLILFCLSTNPCSFTSFILNPHYALGRALFHISSLFKLPSTPTCSLVYCE